MPDWESAKARELRQLREENGRLKRLLADLSLDRQILQEIVAKGSKLSSSSGTGAVGATDAPNWATPRCEADETVVVDLAPAPFV